MYAEINQWVPLDVGPEELGKNFMTAVRQKIRRRFEGNYYDGNYYVAVDEKSINLLDRPIVQDGTCNCICMVRFVSVIFRPFRDQVLYVHVSKVHKVGLMADFGVLRIFIAANGMEGYRHREGTDEKSEAFVSYKDGFEVREGSLVCVKLQGVRPEADGGFKFHAVATLSEPDCGPVRPLGVGVDQEAYEGDIDHPEAFIPDEVDHPGVATHPRGPPAAHGSTHGSSNLSGGGGGTGMLNQTFDLQNFNEFGESAGPGLGGDEDFSNLFN